jgi:GT2 family glycosyltransferase
MTKPSILAIIVSYQRALEESEAFVSLREILQQRSDIKDTLRLLIYDNSPIPHKVPPIPVETRYISNTDNAGLAIAYNTGLKLAKDEGLDWLLLLDQDTVLTEPYLAEAITLIHSSRVQCDVIVPKLMENGVVMSPHFPLTFRHPKPVDIEAYGVSTKEIHPYNSGAVWRVRTLQRLNGFPEDFAIDYLDHAVFRALQAQGGKIFVMRARLEHQLSSNNASSAGTSIVSAREKNILQAENRFYKRYGTFQEQLYHHTHLVWRAGKALRRGSLERGYLLLKAAFTL